MTEPLKPCACGKVPTKLHVSSTHSQRYSNATCHECGEWTIEFEGDYYRLDENELNELAREAWNDAPRGERVCQWEKAKGWPHCYDTSCGNFNAGIGKAFCGYCGGKTQVKENGND